MDEEGKKRLYQELRELEQELADREAALPAHSVRPSQVMEIEDLEKKIEELRKKIEIAEGAG